MDEARIKELALKLWQHPRVAFQSDNRDAVLEIISEHFRIIAAEARKEGIDWMRDVFLKDVYWTYNKIEAAAEQLKKLGK